MGLESTLSGNFASADLDHNPKSQDLPARFTELKSLDITSSQSDIHYQRLLDSLRLEPFFRLLPSNRNENPELYDAVRAKLQNFVSQGSITLYVDGASIHEEKPGQMQFVLAGTVQMTADRYSKKIPEMVGLGYSGPEFSRGHALASWAMAGNTGSHFGEIHTIGPAMTLAISPSQYEELIKLTIKDLKFAQKTADISLETVGLLESLGIVKAYSEERGDLLVLERERDFKKRSLEKDAAASVAWETLKLSQNDFLFCENGNWGVYSHSIQAAIKNATVSQHVLQSNFIYSQEELKARSEQVAPSFRVAFSNDEMRGLARNTTAISNSENVFLDSKDKIFLVVHKTADVEKPEFPLKESKIESQSGKLEVRISRGEGERPLIFELPIPPHGVVDPKEILSDLRLKHEIPSKAIIEGIRFKGTKDFDFYEVDCAAYRKDLGDCFQYSFKRVLSDMVNLGYQMDAPTMQRLETIFEEATGKLLGHDSSYTSLSLSNRAALLDVMDGWLSRDAKDRKGPNPVVVDEKKAAEIERLFAICIGHLAMPEGSLISLAAPIETLSQTEAKLQLIAEEHFEPETLRRLTPEAMKKLYHRDVKHAFGYRADVTIRNLHVTDSKVSEIATPYDVSWIKHEGREVLFVPDRHEDLWGLRHELVSMGVMSTTGKFQLEKLAARRMIMLGDALNRNVSALGYGSMTLVEDLMAEARKYNSSVKEENRLARVEVKMILGNHELDLIRMSDTELKGMFPILSDYAIAKHSKDKIIDMIKAGDIVAAVYLGDVNNPESIFDHALVTHSMMIPEFKDAIKKEMAEKGLPENDLAMTEYLNAVFLEAAQSGDFSHSMFAKSKLRGGKSEFSGCFESDMGNSEKSDLTDSIRKLRATIGGTAAEQDRIIKEKFGYQIGGHSFSTETSEVRTLTAAGDSLILSACLIADCGDHQNFLPNEVAGIKSLIVRETVAIGPDGQPIGGDKTGQTGFAYSIAPGFGNSPPMLHSEDDVRSASRDQDHPYRVALRKYLEEEKPLVTYF